MSLIRRFNLTLMAAAAGWCIGWVAGTIPMTYIQPAKYPFLSERVPLPHRVPQYAGGVSFRFAMAHDVIHERFARPFQPSPLFESASCRVHSPKSIMKSRHRRENDCLDFTVMGLPGRTP
jgi:hypothetical protein